MSDTSLREPADCPCPPVRFHGRASRRDGPPGPVSTRKLIIAALLCGVAILVAGTFLLVSLSTSDVKDRVDQVPPPATTIRP
jgi:hypothetical protein